MSTYDVVGRTEYLGYAAPQTFTGTRSMVGYQPQTSGLESVKEFLEKRSVANIPNKYLIAGAAVVGIAYYGYKHRWF